MKYGMMNPEAAEAWLKILSDPRFLKCLENGRDYRERLAYEILTGKPFPSQSTDKHKATG